MAKPADLTTEQIEQVVQHLKHWSKRTIFRYGYHFKALNNYSEIEILDEAQTTIWLFDRGVI